LDVYGRCLGMSDSGIFCFVSCARSRHIVQPGVLFIIALCHAHQQTLQYTLDWLFDVPAASSHDRQIYVWFWFVRINLTYFI
jgi:hypothetical protein